MKNNASFSKETIAWLIKNAKQDRRWLEAHGLLKVNEPEAEARKIR